VNARGQYGRALYTQKRGRYGMPTVGITLYHSVEDRAAAVRQLDLDWDALYQNLASQVGELTRDPTTPSGYRLTTRLEFEANPPDPIKVAWWKSYAAPLSKEWKKFRAAQLGGSRTFADAYIAFAERWQTNWDAYEDWKKKLDALRADAQRRGFIITASAPTVLPTTVWADAAHVVERSAEAVATGLGDVWPIVKYGAWAALGIGAIVALSSVAQNLRKGNDPAERFLGMIRAPRASSHALSFPRPARRSLPPGEFSPVDSP